MARFNPENFQMPKLLSELRAPEEQAAQLTIAQPFNDYQVVALLAGILVAHEPRPPLEDEAARNEQALRAVTLAIDLLGHASYQGGRGHIAQTVANGLKQGVEHTKQALEAEERAQRDHRGGAS